ncbi:Endoglucanase precursor [compost metagenome]
MAVMLVRAYEWKSGRKFSLHTGSNPFNDSASTSEWAKSSIAEAYAQGWLSGQGDGLFMPQQALTRAESAKVISVLVD